MNKEVIQSNRDRFLEELRSGRHKKGTIKSDEKGLPIINSPEDNEGACACAIMGQMFGEINGKISLSTATKALGLTSSACRYIQQEINDTPDAFDVIADRIQNEVFRKGKFGSVRDLTIDRREKCSCCKSVLKNIIK